MALSQYLAYTDYTCADGPADVFDNRHPDDSHRYPSLTQFTVTDHNGPDTELRA